MLDEITPIFDLDTVVFLGKALREVADAVISALHHRSLTKFVALGKIKFLGLRVDHVQEDLQRCLYRLTYGSPKLLEGDVRWFEEVLETKMAKLSQ